ncbi:hypothetical protein M0R88_16795 [Halorussus gelatinilyticus]|uniref:DUF7965 domain-containing protein n=1 Tax=Halorussus gelatinilyticus TaxID=2937524 RepID=A0A8U0IH22_9EURY|nr:hypothetical protein [Halorussus gelatinilyticus]UPW00158.1 hypothetical protein M0R88_16795 [Halorussus gelatinilyticus]
MAEESASPLAVHRVADDPLVVWALASFHTAALTAVLVGAIYLSGALGDLLSGLDTLLGLGLYLGLWATTWWTTRRAFAAIGAAGRDGPVSRSVVLGTAGKWAGVDGVLFLWVLVGVFAASTVSVESVDLRGVFYFLAIAGVASLLAFVVGAIVGLLFAALDLAAFRVAGSLVADAERERREPAGTSEPGETPEPDEASEPDETV